MGAHKTCFAWLVELQFQPSVTSLKTCFVIAKRHASQLLYCLLLTKADGTVQTWTTVPTRLEDTAKPSLSLCLLLGSCCPGNQARGNEKRQSLSYQVLETDLFQADKDAAIKMSFRWEGHIGKYCKGERGEILPQHLLRVASDLYPLSDVAPVEQRAVQMSP